MIELLVRLVLALVLVIVAATAPRSASQPVAPVPLPMPVVGVAEARSGAPRGTPPPSAKASERPNGQAALTSLGPRRRAVSSLDDRTGSTMIAVGTRMATARPSRGVVPGPTAIAPLPPGTAVVRIGLASTYGPRFSERWVALPEGPGWRFTVCGAGGCRTLTSTDAGPDRAMQREGRIVDLPVGAFESVCGVAWTRGLCNVSVTMIGRVR